MAERGQNGDGVRGTEQVVHDHGSREARLDAFERSTSLPLLVLSVVFIIVVVLPYAVDLDPPTATLLDRVALGIWAVFVAEFAIRLYLAPDKLAFLRGHPLDLLSVALPMLRPLRVVRAARLLRVLTVARVETSILRLVRRGRRAFGRHRIVFSSLLIALITLGAAVVTYEAERGAAGSTLTSFGGALWWAIQVVTTVGAANAYPVTVVGRSAAVVLMIVGVGLFGLVAASLASSYIFRGDEEGSQSHGAQRTDLRAIADRLDRIEAQLASLSAGTPTEGESGRDDFTPGQTPQKAA